MMGSFKGRGNQYIQLVNSLHCKLLGLCKQLSTHPYRVWVWTANLSDGRQVCYHCTTMLPHTFTTWLETQKETELYGIWVKGSGRTTEMIWHIAVTVRQGWWILPPNGREIFQSLKWGVRPCLHKKIQKDSFITFGVTINTDKQTNKAKNTTSWWW